jgi:hypothetical protein
VDAARMVSINFFFSEEGALVFRYRGYQCRLYLRSRWQFMSCFVPLVYEIVKQVANTPHGTSTLLSNLD